MKTETPISENASFILDSDQHVVPFEVAEKLEKELNAAHETIAALRKGSQRNRCVVCGEWVDDVPGPKDPRWYVCIKHRCMTKAKTPWEYIAELEQVYDLLTTTTQKLERLERVFADNAKWGSECLAGGQYVSLNAIKDAVNSIAEAGE